MDRRTVVLQQMRCAPTDNSCNSAEVCWTHHFCLLLLLCCTADSTAAIFRTHRQWSANDRQVCCSPSCGAVQQAGYEDFRSKLESVLASSEDVAALQRYCTTTFADALARLSTPSESAASTDDAHNEEDASPADPLWLQMAHATGSEGALRSHGKFWAQQAQLQALRSNVASVEEQRGNLFRTAAESALLQVCVSGDMHQPRTTLLHHMLALPA